MCKHLAKNVPNFYYRDTLIRGRCFHLKEYQTFLIFQISWTIGMTQVKLELQLLVENVLLLQAFLNF